MSAGLFEERSETYTSSLLSMKAKKILTSYSIQSWAKIPSWLSESSVGEVCVLSVWVSGLRSGWHWRQRCVTGPIVPGVTSASAHLAAATTINSRSLSAFIRRYQTEFWHQVRGRGDNRGRRRGRMSVITMILHSSQSWEERLTLSKPNPSIDSKCFYKCLCLFN